MPMIIAATHLSFLPERPTSTSGRRGVASSASLVLHVVVLAAALSGIWPKYVPPEVPPDMVVEVVLDEPPPPPPPPPPPEPQPLKPEPQPVTPPKPVPVPPKAAPQVKQQAPIPQATTPSPDADAQPIPAPVAPPTPAPIQEERTVQPPPTVRPAADPEVTKVYLSGIKGRVQDKVVYPSLSLKRGEQGTVHVHTSLSRDGAVVDVSADEDGVSSRLRDAAVKAVKDAAPFPPMPDSVPGNPVQVTIPVVFEIR